MGGDGAHTMRKPIIKHAQRMRKARAQHAQRTCDTRSTSRGASSETGSNTANVQGALPCQEFAPHVSAAAQHYEPNLRFQYGLGGTNVGAAAPSASADA